jgi:hypothetical protein
MYRQYRLDLTAAWKQDYPNIKNNPFFCLMVLLFGALCGSDPQKNDHL